MCWYAQAARCPYSSEGLANITAIMCHHFPAETGLKLGMIVVELCQNAVMSINVEPDSGVLKKHCQAGGHVSIYTK
jgi:hypothetical protein